MHGTKIFLSEWWCGWLYPYSNHDELYAFAKQIGAMPKNQFIEHHGIRPSGSWKNDYIRYLVKKIERVLLDTGIRLSIDAMKSSFIRSLVTINIQT
jgi:hypothetical protein